MIEVLAALGGAASVGLAVTCVVLAIRNGGLKANAREADLFRKQADADLKKTAEKLADYRARAEAQIVDLMEEIDELEDQEGEVIAAIKDPAVRRARRRARVVRMLSPPPAGGSGERERGVPDASAPAPAPEQP